MRISKFCCFLIPETTNKYYFFIGFLVGSFFRKCIPGILSNFVFDINKNKNLAQLKMEKYFDVLCNIVSDLLTGIFHCILISKEKNNNENNILINSFIYKRQIKKKIFF